MDFNSSTDNTILMSYPDICVDYASHYKAPHNRYIAGTPIITRRFRSTCNTLPDAQPDGLCKRNVSQYC